MAMLFLKSFIRRLIRHKAFTFINLFGLTFSLAFILLIGSYLLHENSFDKFYKNIDNIYLLTDSSGNDASIDYRMKQILKDNLPEVKNACLYYKIELHLNYLDKVFNEDKVVSVDNDFLSMFDIKLVKGNSQKPLNGLDDALVSESLAIKMFGTEDPVGKHVLLNHKIPLTVVGVVKDFQSNSTLQGNFFVNAENKKMHFNMICPEFLNGENAEDKCKVLFHIFAQLQPGIKINDLETKASKVIPKDPRYPSGIHFSPLKDFHLGRHLYMRGVEQGNPALLRILGSLVLIIALLALINYINLTTAAYKLRLKETGVKKGLGAHRKSIVAEYIFESVIMCLVAAYLSTFVARILMPSFNNFLHTQLNISIFENLKLLMSFFLFSILLGILAGIYPALYLSRISPRDVLASGVFTTRSGKPVRNILNVFQFTIAIVLITVILFMHRQIRFAKTQDLGFKTQNLLRIDMSMQSAHSVNLFIDKLRANPEIISMSPTTGVPGNIKTHLDNFAVIGIDTTFYKTFGIDVIEGRRLLPGDIDKACLINETARKTFPGGIYIGKKIGEWEVVGVVKDFSVSTVHTKLEPLGLFSISWMKPNNLTLRISGNNIPVLMDFIKKSWSEACPDYPLQFIFYDSWFDSMYRNEEGLGKLIFLFALLALVISCIGILGLALFATEQRKKEIGLRKINGASSVQVMFMITKDFTKWIFISFLIALPISYYAVGKWLTNFAYHTKMSWWIFALAGLISFLVALLTVSFQSWNAASKNPVKALRYE